MLQMMHIYSFILMLEKNIVDMPQLTLIEEVDIVMVKLSKKTNQFLMKIPIGEIIDLLNI